MGHADRVAISYLVLSGLQVADLLPKFVRLLFELVDALVPDIKDRCGQDSARQYCSSWGVDSLFFQLKLETLRQGATGILLLFRALCVRHLQTAAAMNGGHRLCRR